MNTSSPANRTIAEVIQSFWSIHWASWAPSTRGSRNSRFVVMAASLLDDPTSARVVLGHIRDKRLRYEDPTTPEGWVARYLQKHFLPTPEYMAKATAQDSSPELEEAARWVALHSKLANEITGEDLIRLRAHLGGSSYYTLRTYWAYVETVLNWARVSGYLDRDPMIGLPTIKRKLDAARVDPDRVPSEEEVWTIANAGGALEGEWFKVAVLVGSFGAMRPGELIALTRHQFQSTRSGGSWLRIDQQHRRYARRFSDDGESTRDVAPPKGGATASGALRQCYIPSRVTWAIAEFVDSRFPDEMLFANSFGNPLTSDTFRNVWNRVIETQPVGPRLAGITPHVMRRAGMSMWLRMGLDLKLIQSWGGWHSLAVMLDTYSALLPGAEEDSIGLLEGRRMPSRRRTSSQSLPGGLKPPPRRPSSSRRDSAITS
jgi:integrase